MSLKIMLNQDKTFPEIQVSTLELDDTGKSISNERVKNYAIYTGVFRLICLKTTALVKHRQFILLCTIPSPLIV